MTARREAGRRVGPYRLRGLRCAALAVLLTSCTCGEPRPTPAPAPAPIPTPAPVPEPAPGPDQLTQATADDSEPPPARVEVTDELPVADMVRESHARMEKLRAAPVHVIRTMDPREAGRAICERTVPHRPPETPVLLKPNLNGFDRLDVEARDQGWQLRTVDVDFLRGIVECLHARGHRTITVIDAWKPRRTALGYFERTGLKRLSEEEGVRIADLWDRADPRPVVRAHYEGARALPADLLVPRVLAEHLLNGLYISVPRLKMHRYTVTSGAIKNAMGVVILDGSAPGHTRADLMHGELDPWWRRFRREHVDDRDEYVRTLELFAERITDVLEVQMPDAVLVDAIPLVAGDGFSLIEPYAHVGYALGSENPIFADAVALEMVGYLDNADLQREIHHPTSPLVESAAQRFYGTTDVLHGIRVVGDDFRAEPRVAHFRGIPGFEIGEPPRPMGRLPWQ